MAPAPVPHPEVVRVEVPVPCLVAPMPEPERSIVVFSPEKPFGSNRCDSPFEACLTPSDAGILNRYIAALQAWAKDTELACRRAASVPDATVRAHEADHATP